MLNFYEERIEIDLNIYRNGTAAILTAEMMMKRTPGVAKKITKTKEEAIERAEAKVAKKKVAAADPENMGALECSRLFLTIKQQIRHTTQDG
jgi:hypothetical protein